MIAVVATDCDGKNRLEILGFIILYDSIGFLVTIDELAVSRSIAHTKDVCRTEPDQLKTK